ncbi:MAG: hypothetical protein WCF03_17555 [Nitrososphaeraceae archaeon]
MTTTILHQLTTATLEEVVVIAVIVAIVSAVLLIILDLAHNSSFRLPVILMVFNNIAF